MQIFVDMDGVLADFDGAYEHHFGVKLDRAGPEPPDLWRNIARHGSFFYDLPVIDDAMTLMAGVREYMEPIVLTGCPTSVPDVEAQKRAWIDRVFGDDVQMICCRSRDKCKHGEAGDILIDDWAKYRHLWVAMGGTFILHTSASASLRALSSLATVAR